MRKTLVFAIGTMLLMGALPAFAQTTTQMYFDGGYQGNVWSGGPEGAVGTGFYDGSINGVQVGPGKASPGMICDDYYDNVSPGQHWTATAYQVSTLNASNIGNTLFGSASGWMTTFHITGVQGYSALAFLANQMFLLGVGNSGLQSSISQALWYITSAAIGHGFSINGLDLQARVLVTAALAASNIPLSAYSNLMLYTQPFNPTGVQEMWGLVMTVPEGGSALMYLVLTGLTCAGCFWQSRRRQASATL